MTNMASMSTPSKRPQDGPNFEWIKPKRNRRQKSEANSYDGPDDMLTPVPHTYQEHRVGRPPLEILPLWSSNMRQSHEAYKRYSDETMQNEIRGILKKYSIKVDELDLAYRHIAGTPPPNGRVTLLIYTLKNLKFEPKDQRNCVAELYTLLNTSIVSQTEITVEILGHPFWAPRYICHVEPEHPFLLTWKVVLQKRFSDILDSSGSLRGHVWSVDLVRLGYDSDRSKNPVTVSITVDWTIDPPAWQNTTARMMRELETLDLTEVQIEFERGEVTLGVTTAPQIQPLTGEEVHFTSVRPGSSLSNGTAQAPEPHRKAIGTIGVVMEVVKAGTTDVVDTVVLTSHSVVRTALPGFLQSSREDGNTRSEAGDDWLPHAEAGLLCQKLDDSGFFFQSQTGERDVSRHVFRSPSTRKIDITIEGKNTEIAKCTLRMQKGNKKYKERLQAEIYQYRSQIDVLQDPGYPIQQLGSIYYSGGLKRKNTEQGRLDVAAVTIEGEALKNASNEIAHKAKDWPGRPPYAKSISTIDLDFGRDAVTPSNEDVYQIGAVTGCTYGTICLDKRANVYMPWHSPTDRSSEATCIGDSNYNAFLFSLVPDSAAAVFDDRGTWLGLIWGGQTKLLTGRLLSYVVPAWAILDDFKAMSGWKLELRLKV